MLQLSENKDLLHLNVRKKVERQSEKICICIL